MDIRGFIDNSILKPHKTEREVEEFVLRSADIGFRAVCLNPCHVRLASEIAGSRIRICSVVGFPLGANTKEVKIHEAVRAVRDGAHEIDVVMNVSAFKSGDYRAVREEIRAVVRETGTATVKVIVETCYLTDEEKARAVELCLEGGADFIKTSTGFGPAGATLEDVRLFRKVGGGRIKIKAAGGIRDLKTALAMIEAGADRIGTSSGFEIYRESLAQKKHLEGGKQL